MELNNCPHCNASLLGDPIPLDILENYDGTHWKREIGLEYPGIYDGTWEFQCPDCDGKWPSEAQIRYTKKETKK